MWRLALIPNKGSREEMSPQGKEVTREKVLGLPSWAHEADAENGICEKFSGAGAALRLPRAPAHTWDSG